jgi:hypothetical protein
MTVTRDEGRLRVTARAVSRIRFDRLDIVQDGHIVADQASYAPRPGVTEARLEREIPVEAGGWIAARVTGGEKTYAGYPAFAHTSPVYLRIHNTRHWRSEARGAFIDEIEESKRLIRKSFKFASDSDRAIAIGRFEEAQRKLAG